MWIAYTDPSDTRAHRQNRVKINQYVGDQYRRRLREAQTKDASIPTRRKPGRRKRRTFDPSSALVPINESALYHQTRDLAPMLNKHIFSNHLDPFMAADVSGHFVYRALDYWINVSFPTQVDSMCLTDPRARSEMLKVMLSWTRTSSLALEAGIAISLATVAGGLDVADAIGRELSRHRANILGRIREMIPHGVNDEIVLGIIVLITIEGMVGLEHTRGHVKIMEDTIHYRGGLENVGSSIPGLQKWLQFASYWVLKKAKTFMSISDDAESAEAVEYPVLPLDDRLQKMIRRLPQPFQEMTHAGILSIPTLRFMVQFVNWRTEIFGLLDRNSRSVDLRVHTFDADIPLGISSLEKIICMTVSALASDVAVHHAKASYALLRIPSQHFEKFFNQLLGQMEDSELDLLIWCVTVYSTPPDRGAIANEWSQALLRRLESRRPNLRSWPITEPILRKYFWDDLCAVHWEKIWAEYAHDMASQIYSISTLNRLSSMADDDQTLLDRLGRRDSDEEHPPRPLPYLVPPIPPEMP